MFEGGIIKDAGLCIHQGIPSPETRSIKEERCKGRHSFVNCKIIPQFFLNFFFAIL